MFEIEYRIVIFEDFEFPGEYGFFKMTFGENHYNEIFPKEIEHIVADEYIFYWFESLVKIVKLLETKEYVALMDIDSYCVWFEFTRKKDVIIISQVNSEEWRDNMIEFRKLRVDSIEWENFQISYAEFKKEIIKKLEQYMHEITILNTETTDMKVLKAINNLQNLLNEIKE